ncbi:MAG: DNA-binding response regulator [Proteobacteria bacterium]|nr:DNA-binding response regulator [Pseudomonadota bacterium]
MNKGGAPETSAQVVWIVDDDPKLGALLCEYLANFNFKTVYFSDPAAALSAFEAGDGKSRQPDLIVSDVMMPVMDGLALMKRIRAGSSVPIVLLTARGDLTDKVLGLEMGADDYLAKPFEPRELVARVQSILRRAADLTQRKRIFRFSDIEIDISTHGVVVDGSSVLLTSTEFEVLAQLVTNAGHIVSRDTLIEQTRGIEWESYNRSIDVMISKLRTKLKCDPQNPRFIKTIRGAGYMFIAQRREGQ